MKANNRSAAIRKVCIIFLFSLAYLYLFARVLWRIGDEGELVYGAQLVAEGALPYRDFFGIMGPGSWYWLGFFFKLFGAKFWVARGLLLATGAVTTILIYWMTRRLYRGPFDTLPALFYLTIGIPSFPCTSHHWDSNLFALIAVSALFLWQEKKSFGYLIMAGVLAGLTSCFMQQKGLFLFLSFLAILVSDGCRAKEEISEIFSNLGVLLFGYVSIGIFVIAFFYLAGGLPDLIYATLIFPMTAYYESNLTPYGHALLEFVWPASQGIMEIFSPPLVGKTLAIITLIPYLLIMALPILLVILAASIYVFEENRPKFLDGLMLPYWIVGFALWVSEIQRKDFAHLVFGSPLLVILVFVLWNKVSGNKRMVGIPCFLFVACLLFCGAYKTIVAAAANEEFATRRGGLYLFREDTALRFLHEHLISGEEVFVYPFYPMYYFLADVKNPTRFNALFHWPNTEAKFNEAINELEKKKVKYVLWDTFMEGVNLKKWSPAYRHPPEDKMPLEMYLRSHYEIIGFESGWRILRRLDIYDR